MSSEDKVVCAACGRHVHPVGGAGAMWSVAVVLGYGVMIALVFLASLAGPFLPTVVLPVFMLVGLGMMAPLHERAGRLPECPACGKYVEARLTTAAPHAASTPRGRPVARAA
ncbi:MAG: hypothetical protein HY904_15945 [Deltaproteobacteria bacterium]|nr:hypothetical protein [Deltaproteobacteria bacterium]